MYTVKYGTLRKKRTGTICVQDYWTTVNLTTDKDLEEFLGQHVIVAFTREKGRNLLHNIVRQHDVDLDNGLGYISNSISYKTGEIQVVLDQDGCCGEVNELLAALTKAVKEIGPNGL